VTAKALVLGIDSDRLFPVPDQQVIAANLPGNLDGKQAHVISSPFGHDGFLIEDRLVGAQILRLLNT
jgi:homoserine O-acetyltransferase